MSFCATRNRVKRVYLVQGDEPYLRVENLGMTALTAHRLGCLELFWMTEDRVGREEQCIDVIDVG